MQSFGIPELIERQKEAAKRIVDRVIQGPVYCPVCGFEMKETRGCCPWCRNRGYKSVCGDLTS
ncbi:hypothetical protein GCM10025859_00890 [Alicyclobacillus fastidiosus]|nr:hypothetical protein GCM10025859_00890 [Alicyclobacillus fastidiosus]